LIENPIYDDLNVGKPVTFTVVVSDPNEVPVHKLINYVIDNANNLNYGSVTYTRYTSLKVKSVRLSIANVKLTDKFLQEFSRTNETPTDDLRIEFEGFVTRVELFPHR